MQRDDLLELLPGYVAGVLEPGEASRVEAELERADPEVLGELAFWRETLATAEISAAEPQPPSETVRRRVLAAVAAQSRAAAEDSTAGRSAAPFVSKSDRGRTVVPWLALAASALALLVGGAAWWQGRGQRDRGTELARQRDRLAQEVELLRRDVSDQDARFAELAGSLKALSLPRGQRLVLAGLESAPASSGSVVVRPDNQTATFLAFGLPQLAANKIYQLWFIGSSGPVSAGIFGVDEEGDATLQVATLSDPADIQVWAVTLEPAGGVPQPTGPMLLKS